MKHVVPTVATHSKSLASPYGQIPHYLLTPRRFLCFEHIKIRYVRIMQIPLKSLTATTPFVGMTAFNRALFCEIEYRIT
jgi:hypothetical protein